MAKTLCTTLYRQLRKYTLNSLADKITDLSLKNKFLELCKALTALEKVAIVHTATHSGSLLAYLGHRLLGENSISLVINSQFVSEADLANAVKTAKVLGYRQEIILIDSLGRSEITANLPMRCLYCTDYNFSYIKDVADIMGYSKVAESSDSDDRISNPGERALKKHGIISPLADAEITAEETKKLALELGMPNAERKAVGCLACKIANGTQITAEILNEIEALFTHNITLT